jgi:hypothetical protein
MAFTGAVVSNPMAKKTTCLSGFSEAMQMPEECLKQLKELKWPRFPRSYSGKLFILP